MRRLVVAVIFFCAFAAVAPHAYAAYGDITLLGQTPLTGSTDITDVWGWVDTNTNKEYAIVGNWNTPNRVWIVDVSNPAVPTELDYVDGASGFDVKVFGDYIYAVDGNSAGKDGRIIHIAAPNSLVLLDNTFYSAHNVATSPDGYLFGEIPGMTIYDLTDPENPDSLWRSSNFNGHDATPIGDSKVWDFGGWDNFARLWDYSNPENPTMLLQIDNNFAGVSMNYCHSGDVTEDGNYLYVCDEVTSGTETDVWVFDISDDPQAPFLADEFYLEDSRIHNLYIIGDLAFVSYYTRGFVTLDVSTPDNPVVADEYDTNVATGDVYDGAFGVYPFLPSGNILISDWDNGLFVFGVEGHNPNSGVGDTPSAANTVTLLQNYPNPFHPSTSVRFELTRGQQVELSVYDVAGRHVRTLVDGWRGAGGHEARWNGRNQQGQEVASGVYLYRVKAGGQTVTKRMVLLR